MAEDMDMAAFDDLLNELDSAMGTPRDASPPAQAAGGDGAEPPTFAELQAEIAALQASGDGDDDDDDDIFGDLDLDDDDDDAAADDADDLDDDAEDDAKFAAFTKKNQLDLGECIPADKVVAQPESPARAAAAAPVDDSAVREAARGAPVARALTETGLAETVQPLLDGEDVSHQDVLDALAESSDALSDLLKECGVKAVARSKLARALAAAVAAADR